MHQVKDEPTETIHVYVVREGQQRPSLVPLLLSLLALCLLIAVGILTPSQQPEEKIVIRVPAVLLPVHTVTTSIEVLPTGSKTYPATHAHGVLTIYNGSILSQELPQGMILTGKDGIEVTTDEAVSVPAGNPPSYGIATVPVHAVAPGQNGNIQAFDITQVYGTSLYIRNLHSFTGGKDAYTITFITPQDHLNALVKARQTLLAQIDASLYRSPCRETITGSQMLSITWTCQFVTYETPRIPGVRVLDVLVAGKTILLEIVFVARPRRLETK